MEIIVLFTQELSIFFYQENNGDKQIQFTFDTYISIIIILVWPMISTDQIFP